MSLEKQLRQLDRNSKQLVSKIKKEAAKSINYLASQAKKKATKTVAKNIGVPVKTLKGRTRQRKNQRATTNKPVAILNINLSPMPLIRVLESKRNSIKERQGSITVGKHSVQRGFVQTLKNGRTHIMQRKGKARYSIDVVKVPIRTALVQAYSKALKNYPSDLQQELGKRLNAAFK